MTPILGIVGLDARIAFNPFVVLEEHGRDPIGQVGGHVIERSRLKVPKPNEDVKIRDG